MTQTEKDALIKAEKENYKKLSSTLYDEQQRVSQEYKTKLCDIANTMLRNKDDHNKRMAAIMAIEAERKPADGVDGDERRKLHATRVKIQKYLEDTYGIQASVHFVQEGDEVKYTIDIAK